MVRFGPFSIDSRTWTLARDGVAVPLSPRLVEILAYLVSRDGAIATKEELLDRFWPAVHVTENTLTRAIADIRKALGDAADHPQVIQTLARRGYRYVGARPAAELADPFQQWVGGRLALESLDPARLADATTAMQAAVEAMPGYAAAHTGLANAWVARYETTRAHNVPDTSLLEHAVASARRAAGLDPSLGEAWAVLSHAQTLAGRRDEAQASARHAVALEPGNWRHGFRLALGAWGEERLRAVDRVLALLPSCAGAHLLAAMVFVARGAWSRAETAAAAGARVQDAQVEGAVLPAAGLHWMHGLVLAATGRADEALRAFAREAESAVAAVYAAESRWLAHTSAGFLHARAGRRQAARESFRAADALNPGAARGVLGLHVCGEATAAAMETALAELETGAKAADAVLLRAARAAWAGDRDRAHDLLRAAIAGAPPGPFGWSLGTDPVFAPAMTDPRHAALLAAVAARAA